MKNWQCRVVLWIFCSMFSVAQATPAEDLLKLLSHYQALSAQFTQITRLNNQQQLTQGHLLLAKPNRFVWAINRPHTQKFVSDGQTMWQYDPALNQVIVHNHMVWQNNTPLAILTGQANLAQSYTIVKSNPNHFVLTSKNPQALIPQIQLWFTADLPARLRLINATGQATQVDFSQVQLNPKLTDGEFKFVIPKSADVFKM